MTASRARGGVSGQRASSHRIARACDLSAKEGHDMQSTAELIGTFFLVLTIAHGNRRRSGVIAPSRSDPCDGDDYAGGRFGGHNPAVTIRYPPRWCPASDIVPTGRPDRRRRCGGLHGALQDRGSRELHTRWGLASLRSCSSRSRPRRVNVVTAKATSGNSYWPADLLHGIVGAFAVVATSRVALIRPLPGAMVMGLLPWAKLWLYLRLSDRRCAGCVRVQGDQSEGSADACRSP